MRVKGSARGSILYETLLLVALVTGAFCITEVKVIRLWNEKIESLQLRRLPYDGRRP
jgi:hypothetical protein